MEPSQQSEVRAVERSDSVSSNWTGRGARRVIERPRALGSLVFRRRRGREGAPL